MKKLLKWTGIVLGCVVALLLIAGFALYTMGNSTMNQTFEVTPAVTAVTADSASLARGEHLSKIHGCQYCHGDNMEGRVFLDVPPFLAVASNLTAGKGGVMQAYTTDADWDRAIRHGIKPNGKSVLLMPSKLFNNLSDDDASALIAYLKNVPPMDNELPASELRAMGAIIAGTGGLGPEEFIQTEPARTTAPPVSPTAEYGTYLTGITCIDCHGADLRGGPSPNPDLPGPDLAVAGSWPYEAFAKAMRTGVNPGGKELSSVDMPWPAFTHMTDDELKAIHEHLKTLRN